MSSSSPSTSSTVESSISVESDQQDRGNSKTNHLVLMLGNAVLHAFSTSTFALTYLREHALNPVPSRVIECPSSTDTHTCQKRTFATNFDEQAVCRLYEEMPNVTKLEVMCAPMELTDERICESVIYAVVCLTAHWAKSLVTMKLLFQYEPDAYAALVEAITRLSELRHLTLEIDQRAEHDENGDEDDDDQEVSKDTPKEVAKGIVAQKEVKLDLPVLTKLEEFFFRAPVISPQLLDTIKKHGESANSPLKRIGLGNERGINGKDMQMLIDKFEPSLAVRFVHVPTIQRPFRAEQLTTFMGAFRSITSLDIDAAELSLVTLARCLAPLSELLYLRLANAFSQLEHPLAAEDSMPPEQICPLGSVRGLTLELFAKSHVVLKSAHWGRIFPGLLEVKVSNHRTNCARCDGGSRTSFTKPSAEAKIACTRQLMEPLKQCAQLQVTFPVNIVGGQASSGGDRSINPTGNQQPAKDSSPAVQQ